MVKEKRPNLVFLMETKLQALRVELLKSRLGFESVFVVDCVGRNVGLGLFWNDGFEVEIQNYSRRLINTVINNGDRIALESSRGFIGTRKHTNERRHGIYYSILGTTYHHHGYVYEILMKY